MLTILTANFQEYEIDKTLGIRGPEDVAKMGIVEYNNQCRAIVMRYSTEWKVCRVIFGRMNENFNF